MLHDGCKAGSHMCWTAKSWRVHGHNERQGHGHWTASKTGHCTTHCRDLVTGKVEVLWRDCYFSVDVLSSNHRYGIPTAVENIKHCMKLNARMKWRTAKKMSPLPTMQKQCAVWGLADHVEMISVYTVLKVEVNNTASHLHSIMDNCWGKHESKLHKLIKNKDVHKKKRNKATEYSTFIFSYSIIVSWQCRRETQGGGEKERQGHKINGTRIHHMLVVSWC